MDTPVTKWNGKGGKPFDASFTDANLRADLCAIAIRHCYEHGAHVVDDILANFHVRPKSIKEPKR